MIKITKLLALCLTAFLLLGSVAVLAADAPASAPTPSPKTPEKVTPPAASPDDHVQVQHILIGFKGSVPGKNITRTQEEAQKLADDILARAKKGEDFDALVKQYTDDSPPGIYKMSNTGVTPAGAGEMSRSRMVKGFGDMAFSLKPGEIGVAVFDAKASPYGWHIIKRLS